MERRKEELLWLKEAHSQVLQQVLRNLDTAYNNFFAKRAKRHNFKKKHVAKQSIQYPQCVKTKDESLVYLPKVGWTKAVIHRELVGTIKTVTISTSSTGKYFASILTDDGIEATKTISHIKTIEAMDVGINDLVIT